MVNKKFEIPNKCIVPKILVFSDEPDSAVYWASSLMRNNLTAVHQSSFGRAIETWENEVPDMILIDTNGSNAYAQEFVGKLRNETIIPLILLTNAIPENEIIEIYLSGVDDCIIKPVKLMLVILKIRAWLRQTRTLSVDVMDTFQIGDFSLIFSERILTIANKSSVKLTNLELRLLYLLMTNSERTVSYEKIIQRVWGYQSEVDYAALKNVVYRLRKKIELRPTQPQYLITLPEAGYKFMPNQE